MSSASESVLLPPSPPSQAGISRPRPTPACRGAHGSRDSRLGPLSRERAPPVLPPPGLASPRALAVGYLGCGHSVLFIFFSRLDWRREDSYCESTRVFAARAAALRMLLSRPLAVKLVRPSVAGGPDIGRSLVGCASAATLSSSSFGPAGAVVSDSSRPSSAHFLYVGAFFCFLLGCMGRYWKRLFPARLNPHSPRPVV